MRAFACSHCGQLLFFENSHCLRCGTAVGMVPELLALTALDPAPRASEEGVVDPQAGYTRPILKYAT